MIKHAPPPPPTPRSGLVALRGPSGRLYGYLDLSRMVIECKRKNEAKEEIDLSPFLGKS